MILPMLAAAAPHEVFICVFDAHRKNWRNDIYPDYKANRQDTPADLVAQIEMTRDAARAFGMPVLVVDNVEADDVIATLTRHECALGRKTRVITGDKDLMQLVSNCVFLYDGMKDKEIHEPEVLEKFGVKPDQVIDVQSLMGDSTDNIPGVPGIGPKTAGELIGQFGSLDNLYKHVNDVAKERIKNLLIENKDKAYISHKLVSLKTDVKLPKFSDGPFHFDYDAAIEFVRTILESHSLENKIVKLFGNSVSSRGREAQSGTMPEQGYIKTQHDELSDIHELTGSRVHGSAAPRDDTGHLHYKLITTESELDKFLETVGDVLAIDTETTGLDHFSSQLVGISLATAPNYGVYIPLRHKQKSDGLFDESAPTDKHHAVLAVDVVKQKLWPVLTNHKILKVGHNLKFDFHIFANEGWDTDKITPFDDTMLLSYVLHGTAHAHSLDELAHIYLGHDTIKFESLFPPKTKDKDKSFAHLDPARAAEYAAEDAYITFALYGMFRPQLDRDEKLQKLYERCDRPLLRVLFHMERAGILVDQGQLQKLSSVLHKNADEIQKKVWRVAGHEFNIASPKQLGEVLYDKMKIAPAPKNKSTGAGTLSELVDTHPIVPLILEWRTMAKLAGTYADALPRQIGRDGRIHTTFLQTSTNTGRLSSRDPNLQNIPIKTDLGLQIRNAFIAPPGRVLVSADYSQIQLRLLAHIADVSELKRAFLAGEDIHDATARHVFKIHAGAHVPKDLRAKAKTVNFSIIYGVSPFGLAAQLDISRDEAKQLIDSYMKEFPEIGVYMEKTKDFAQANAYVLTPWGRRIELPEVKNPRMRAYALRAAINAPIQGAEADMMRLAMIKIAEELDREPDAEMLLQVHDEIVFECDRDAATHLAKKVKEIMESAVKLSVPLIADFSIGDRWEK